MISEVALARYLLLFCFIYLHFNGKANAENVAGNQGGLLDGDSPQFHDKMAHERRHLLAHLADRMDLDGEGLRHIQKHFGQQAGDTEQNKDLKDVASGDNTKGIFYFFKFHDYDDNQKLDGLEWMQALTDFHEEDDNKGEFKEGGKMFLEHEAEAIVDELLSKHDKNDDGMIDFIELMNQNVNSFMTELDKPPPEDHEAENENQEQQQQNEEAQSSLEQEFNKLQQAQQDQNQGQQEDQQQKQQPQQDQQHDQDNQEHEQQTQDNQQQQQENDQQELNSEKMQSEQEGKQEQQHNEQQNQPSSLEEEYNSQQQEHS